MNICFLIDDYSAVGGIQRVVPIVANALSNSFNIKVVSMYNEHNNNNSSLYNDKVYVLIEGKKNYLRQCIKASLALRKFIIQNNVDVLISTSEMLTPYCLIASSLKKTKFYCWTHSTAYRYNEALLQRPFKFLMMHTAKKVVALTNGIKEELDKKYKTNNVVVIPNPIDPKLFNNKAYNLESKKIITVGRFCYEKYYEKLVEVAKLVLENNKEWTWDIYGDGNARKDIEERVTASNLIGNVILKGNVNNLYDLYNDYSILVMTSRSEAYPMALLEGMASNLPLVAFAIPGVNEIIKDKINGETIECFDERKMADVIKRLMDDKEIRLGYANNNLKLRENYKIDAIKKLWISVLTAQDKI